MDPRLIQTAQILKDIYKDVKPHDKQSLILRDLFYNNVKDIYVECGRKFGKTFLLVDALRRYALLNPNAGCYYIAPFQKQAREILWVSKALHRMIPQHYIKGVNNTEMRITLYNDAFIKLDGADNHESYRGIAPHILGYDEIKDHDPAFHVAMNPNRAVYNAPLIVIGTPPETEGPATDMKHDFESNPKKRYYNFPSSCNPHISKEWLENEREALFKRGEHDTWYREYEAKFVRGGKNAIFPMLDEKVHFHAHEKLLAEISRDKHKLEWYCTADPGSTSVFAVLFLAINQFTKKVYILDEIYETNQEQTTTSSIMPRIADNVAILCYGGSWRFTYDEAASWFASESRALGYDPTWSPTKKSEMPKDPMTKEPWGLSIMKDIMINNQVAISDRCVKTKWELLNYVRIYNRNNDVKVPKRNDHLIDCIRYTLSRAYYKIPEKKEPPKEISGVMRERKIYTLEDDIKADLIEDFYDF